MDSGSFSPTDMAAEMVVRGAAVESLRDFERCLSARRGKEMVEEERVLGTKREVAEREREVGEQSNLVMVIEAVAAMFA